MRNAAGQVVGGWTIDRVATGAGGWVTSLDVSDDGTLVARTDTYNAYVRKPSDTEWKPLFDAGKTIPNSEVYYDYRPPASDYIPTAYDVCISATDSNVIYAAMWGFVFKSTDGGVTMVRTALPQVSNLHPTLWRIGGRKMAVDPANPNVLGLGAYGNGLIYTLDGGSTWTTHPDIPVAVTSPDRRRICVAFDRSSTVVSGRTQTVVVFVGGVGVFRSTTGINGTFTLLAGSPTDINDIYVVNGVIHTIGTMQNAAPGQYYRFASGSWTAPSGVSGTTIAIRPTNPNQIQMFNDGGYRVSFSTDGGVSWTSHLRAGGRQATDIPWLAWTYEVYMSNGATIYHPTLDRIFFAQGLGVWYTDSLNYTASGGNVPWISMSKGIEQLCSQEIIVNPNGKVLVSTHDRAFFTLERDSIKIHPSSHGSQNTVNPPISHGISIDYAIDDPDFLVGGETSGYRWSYSQDGGKNWVPFVNLPDITGGNVAVSNKNNIVVVPTNNRRPKYSLDGGSTWNNVVLDPLYDASQGFHTVYFLRRLIVVADKAVPGTFYLFCYGTGSGNAQDLAMRGLWRSTNGGVNWTRVFANFITTAGQDYWNSKLKMVPGRSPHMMWACGRVNTAGDAPTDVGLRFSSDGGASWTTVPGLIEPQDFCWSAPKPGAYPMLWAYGWVGGEIGLYRMEDFNPTTASGTWQFVTKWPYGTFDELVLGGDAVKFGRMYLGLYGGGQLFAEYSDKARAT